MEEEPARSALTRLISVPGLVAVAVLGVAVAAAARFFGPGNVLREVVTEMIASFGSTILVLAVFGLIFRTRIERLLRGAPGGEALTQSIERLEDLLQNPGAHEPEPNAELDLIGKDVRSLAADEVPALRKEVAELRGMLADLRDERG